MIDLQSVIRFVENAVGSPYVFGGTGKPCTPDYRAARMKQYPVMALEIRRNCRVLSGKAGSCEKCRYNHRLCYDCAQFVKAALKEAGVKLPSGATSQWTAKGMWAFRGLITYQAANHCCLVFRAEPQGQGASVMEHVGISLGNGWVADARGHQAGVIRSKLSAYPWTHMAFPAGFPLPDRLGEKTQPDESVKETKTGIKTKAPAAAKPVAIEPPIWEQEWGMGSRGAGVRLLQTQLMRLGYPLPRYGADEKYGRETAQAVVAFQRVAGLDPGGRADLLTMARLFPHPEKGADPKDDLDDDGNSDEFDLF